MGKSQNGGNYYLQVKFDLERQGQSIPKTIENLTKVFCTSNVVIFVERVTRYRADKLVINIHAYTHTDAGNDNTPSPKLATDKI